MRKFFLAIFFLSALFLGSFFASRHLDLRSAALPKAGLLVDAFRPANYPLRSRPFVIAIIGHNNGASLQKTLDSVFTQTYDNFRAVYIDDASDDGSFDLASDLIASSPSLLRVDCVRNETELGHLANLTRIVQECSDEEIVVVLEGEDWLAHEWVLQRLNLYYEDPELWLTYGQSLVFPTFEMGAARPFKREDIEESGLRGHPFVASHVKTFYAALFKKIKQSDFIYQGKFLPNGAELAYMIPMLEMAKDHFHYIPEVLYIATPNQKQGKINCEHFVRSLPAYEPLTVLFNTPIEDP